MRDPHEHRTAGPADEQLQPIIGTWRVTGANAPGAVPVVGEERFERMAGGFFVHGRFERTFEGGAHGGVIILGYDRDRSAIMSNHYDNLGYAREYVVTIDGATWTFTGRYERATYRFGPDSYAARWELSADGHAWQPLCELRGVRAA